MLLTDTVLKFKDLYSPFFKNIYVLIRQF